MPKRITETKIWSTQRWYKKLHPYHKLAWKYLTDCCDHAGIWKIDFGQLVDDTGIEDFDLGSFIEACNKDEDKLTGRPIFRERIMQVSPEVLWLTGFIKFQYETKDFNVNPEVKVVKSALTILNGYGILQKALDKGYITLQEPLDYPSGTPRKGRPAQNPSKNVANTPSVGDIAPKTKLNNPSEDMIKDIGGVSKGLSNPSEGLKNIEHNTSLESKEELETSYGEEGNPEESKKGSVIVFGDYPGVVWWNVEEVVLSNPIHFEKLCMDGEVDHDVGMESLHKYHLHLIENHGYPKNKTQLLAGFEKWILKEKKFQNGRTKTASSGTKLGTSEARTRDLECW